MTRRRISNTTPRELSAAERKVVSDVVLERDSDFRVKTGSVPNPLLYTPDPGVFVISEQDGKMYYANQHGWYQQGADTSPIILYVEYDGVTQFDFKFKLPSTKYVLIDDGDGTRTLIQGQDDVEITHTTAYTASANYKFFVDGDVYDLTHIQLGGMTFVTGDLAGFGLLINLTSLQFPITGIYGDISTIKNLSSLITLVGSISDIHGDVSTLKDLPSIGVLRVSDCAKLTFDSSVDWTNSTHFYLDDCLLTEEMVDNALISLATLPLVSQIIKLAGNNAPRTSASNDAMVTLIANGNTVTVNENPLLTATVYNGTDQYSYVADNGALDINQAGTDFCICGWIRTTNITTQQYVFGKNIAGVVDGSYGLYIASGAFYVVSRTSTGPKSVTDNITLEPDIFYHIAIRFDLANSRTYFYIDGVLQNTGGTLFTGTFGTLANAFEFYIAAGNNADGSDVQTFLGGQSKDVRIYHKDISAQLTELMNGEGLGDEVAWWKLGVYGEADEVGAYDLTNVGTPTIE